MFNKNKARAYLFGNNVNFTHKYRPLLKKMHRKNTLAYIGDIFKEVGAYQSVALFSVQLPKVDLSSTHKYRLRLTKLTGQTL